MTGALKLTIGSVVMTMALFLIAGCESSTKEAAPEAAAGISTVGVTGCYNCHADARNPASFPTVFGDTDGSAPVGSGTPAERQALEGWLNGPHGNYESWNGVTFTKVDNAPNNTGFPYYADPDYSDAECKTCHDPLGEGRTITDFYIQTGVDSLGIANRPVIGCENCHGSGGNHWGLGPIPYPKPSPDRCGQCHNVQFRDDHLPFHPEGRSVTEDYQASPHASSINQFNYVTGSTTDVKAECSRCHTDEGAKRYISVVNGTATYSEIVSSMAGKPDVANAAVNQCRTCHDGHNQLILLGEKAGSYPNALPGTWSGEFKACTSCHQLLTTTLDPTYGIYTMQDLSYHAPYDKGGSTTNANPFGDSVEMIPDTHYDDPATPTRDASGGPNPGTGGIEGYVVVPSATHDGTTGNANTGTCLDCHNPHKADNTINRQWARSAHGGEILEIKEAATNAYTAAVTDAEAPGWVHYNWKLASRAACQRCHTSTGFRNFANSQTTYDANGDTTPDTPNDFSHLTGEQLELLGCWACHTDNIGTMRNPGPITANYNVFISGVKYVDELYTYPDVSKSNVCMGCHTGRESGESIKQLNVDSQPGVADFSNLSFINSHYLTAGGTVFTATGYEYTGKNYANPASYKHDKIGSAAAPGTGTSGPCAGCHMSAPESHLFLPVTRDANGVITAITSPACSICHPNDSSGEALSLSASVLENQKTLLHDSLEALLRQLDARGYYFRNAFPYFYQVRYNTGTVSASVTDGTTVTGSGTTWTGAGIVVTGSSPDQFKVNLDGTYYVVASVTDDTHLELTTAYTGPTVVGATYSIIRSGSAATSAVRNWLTQSGPAPFVTPDTDTTGATSGKNNMGAAFNYNLLEHDPGAFAHNRYYSRRLIYDAIDWLDNNSLDDTVQATLNVLDPTDHPYKANAMAYILSATGGRP